MRYLRRISRSLCALLAVAMGLLSVQTSAYAGMVGTATVLAEQQHQLDRERLGAMLERSEVQAQLSAMGVDPEQARERISALTDEEVQSLSGRLGEAPAGGNIVGVAVFIFLILLLTDILGYTDIFPFVKKTAQ